MKILVVGKYPPIEGGTASRTYSLVRQLGERGHQVAVVTNAPRVEERYRIVFDPTAPEHRGEYIPPNVTLYAIEERAPRHIPYSEGFVTRLVNEGLRAISEHGAEVIYAYYLEPYGVAGLLLKELTGLPLVVQHAGSDIFHLLRDKEYTFVLGRVLRQADVVITGHALRTWAEQLGIPRSRIETRVQPVFLPQFAPEGEKYAFPGVPAGVPVVTYLGKANPNKGLRELLGVLRSVRGEYRAFLFSNGSLRSELEQEIAADPRLAGRVRFMDFVPPWVVPLVLRGSDVLVQLEHDFFVQAHTPVQPYEAILTQTPLLLSTEVYAKMAPYFPKTCEHFAAVDPKDPAALEGALERLFADLPGARERAREIREEYLATRAPALERYEQIFAKAARKGRRWF